MIRPTRVDVEQHSADFRCSIHDAWGTNINLWDQTRYIRGSNVKPVYIRVRGQVLTQGTESHCLCSTLINVPGRSEIERTLDAAKFRDELWDTRPDEFRRNRVQELRVQERTISDATPRPETKESLRMGAAI